MNSCVNRSNKLGRRGFTLVELVVVVLIIGILSAVAAPRLFNQTENAKVSGTRQSLAVLRNAIELYKAQSADGTLPAAAQLAVDLRPFLKGPFPKSEIGSSSDAVVAGTSPLAVTGGGGGWVYDAATGDIAINHSSAITW